MVEKLCVLTGVPITDENDSLAHVIPSALGGRLKPRGIICGTANEILNNKVDLPLINSFHPTMALLGGSRDRGATPSLRLSDRNGRHYEYEFHSPISLTKPKIDIQEIGDRVIVSVEARTEKEARTLLGKVKKKYPAFDVDQAMSKASIISEYLDEHLHVKQQIGPATTFPAAFVAASLFSAYIGQSTHPMFRQFIEIFDPEQPTLPPDTFYWYPQVEWSKVQNGQVAHTISAIGDAAKQLMLVCVKYFGIVSIGVLFPYKEKFDCCDSYAVDVLTGMPFELQINETALRSISWAETHSLNDRSVIPIIRERLANVLLIAQSRSIESEIGRLVDEVLGVPDGRPLSEQDVRNLVSKVTPFLLSRIRN